MRPKVDKPLLYPQFFEQHTEAWVLFHTEFTENTEFFISFISFLFFLNNKKKETKTLCPP